MSQPHDFDPFAPPPTPDPGDGPARHDGAPEAFDADGTDAPLDPALLAVARAYHAPPPPPVDAMWAAIQARRANAAAGSPPARVHDLDATTRPALTLDVNDRPAVVRRRDAWGRAARRWAPLAAAAAVLLATGIGIGRYSTSRPALPAAPTTAATRPPLGTNPPGPAVAAAEGGKPAAPPSSHAATLPQDVASGRRPDAASHGPTTTVAAAVRRPDARAVPGVPEPRDAASAPLRAATDRHLADAEVLLTAFAAVGGGAQGPPPAAAPDSAWARDLLVTTRLLLDSPAGRDPARRTLLESLELVLVQIARLPHADTPAERALIDRAIRNGDLLARLRSAVPSGPVRRAGAQGA